MVNVNKENFQRLQNTAPEGGKLLDKQTLLARVDNGISSIQLFKEDRFSQTVAGWLEATPSVAVDKDKLAVVIDPSDRPTDVAQFETWLKGKLDAQKAYLFPDYDAQKSPTRKEFNNIVGQRVDQARSEMLALAKRYTGADLNKALWAVNTAGRDLMDRKVDYDQREMNGYGSFGHDATFAHVYEAMFKNIELRLADEGAVALMDPAYKASLELQKKQCQAEVDFLFRSKYVYHSSDMKETDAEHSIGLICIDQKSRQRVSESASTRNSLKPTFEIINMPQPDGRAVFFDVTKDKYFFDGTTTEVPAEAVAKLVRKTLSRTDQANLTFRRTNGDEVLRSGFRFDWNTNGIVEKRVIDWVSWAGHCNNKSELEAQGLIIPTDTDGIVEYDAASGTRRKYTPDQLNEMLLSFSEFGSAMSTGPGMAASVDPGQGKTGFWGARDDDRPDRLTLSNGREIPLETRTNKFDITEVTLEMANAQGVMETRTLKAEEAFTQKILAEDHMSAVNNPLYEKTAANRKLTEGDILGITLENAKIKAKIEVQTFDDTGYPTMEAKDIELDFKNPPTGPVLVDTMLEDSTTRKFYEISLEYKADSKEWMWSYKLFQMVAQADGKFKKEEAQPTSAGSERFDPTTLVARRETSLDNPVVWLPFVRDAMKTGESGTAETADGAGVWNGRLHHLEQKLEKRVMDADGKGGWELVQINVDARYGSNTGKYLARLNAKGEQEYCVPVEMAADFFWRKATVMSPAFEGLGNKEALDRGAVTRQREVSGTFAIRADALNDMMQVLHCAFSKKGYTVVGLDGQRYVYEDKAAWQAAVKQLETARRAALNLPEPVAAEVIDWTATGTVAAKGEVKYGPIKVAADGILEISLADSDARRRSGRADADIYVAKNREPSQNDSDWSGTSGSVAEKGTIGVKAGDEVYVMVYGYAAPAEGEQIGFNVRARSLTQQELDSRRAA